MRKLLKALAWIAGIAAAVAVAIPLAIIAVNAFDEELSAEAKALTAPPQALPAGDDSAYVLFLGLDAPAGEDQRGWGLKVLASLRAQDASAAGSEKAPPVLKSAPLVEGKVARWCNPAAHSCMAAVPADSIALLKEHALALERYRTMQAQPSYVELYVPDRLESAYPSYAPLIGGQAVSLLAMAVAANAGNIRAALDGLEREMAFHRRMADGSRTLLGKMVANSLLARDLLFLSDLMHEKRDALGPHLDRIAILLRPLSAAERSLATAYRADSASFARYMLTIDRERIARDAGSSAWWRNFAAVGYQRNATANLVAEQLQEILAVDEAPASRYEQAAATYRARLSQAEQASGLKTFVNPTGRILVNVAAPDRSDYTGRMHDLHALFALVGLQRALYAEGRLTPEAVVDALADPAYVAYGNPYTGKPMAYDAQSGTLSFAPASGAAWAAELRKRRNGRAAVALN